MDSCIHTLGGRKEYMCLQTACNHPLIEYLFRDHINVSVCAKDLSTSETEIVTMNEVTNISVTWETHTRLSEMGRKSETFNHIVERLLDAYRRHENAK